MKKQQVDENDLFVIFICPEVYGVFSPGSALFNPVTESEDLKTPGSDCEHLLYQGQISLV